MNKINLTAFHNQERFMQDVREGEKIIAQSDRELARMPVEKCNFKEGDWVKSTGTGGVIEGQIGKVFNIYLVGKFWRVEVNWENNYHTAERVQDLKLYRR